MKNALQNRPHCRHANCIGRYHPIKGGHRCSRCDDEVGEDFKPLPMTHDKVEQSLLPVTQAHRDAAAEWLGSPDGGAGTLRIGKIIAGNFDGHPLVQAFARFERDILARHRGSTAVDAEYFASLLSSATEAAKVAEVCAFLAAKYDGIGNAAIANGHSPKAHRISKAYEGHLNRIRDALGNIAALASLSTTPATAENEGEHLHAAYEKPSVIGPEAREILARVFEPGFPVEAEKARKGLHFMLPSSWAVEAVQSALTSTPDRILPDAVREAAEEARDTLGYIFETSDDHHAAMKAETAWRKLDASLAALTPDRIGKDAVREAAQALVAKLDECDPHIADAFLMREMKCGPYEGPNYSAELRDLRRALSATPAQPVDETERLREAARIAMDGLYQVIALDHHNMGPESKATTVARAHVNAAKAKLDALRSQEGEVSRG